MILTVAKFQENLLRDSTLSLLFRVKFFSSLETKMILKIQNETFLGITRYRYLIRSKRSLQYNYIVENGLAKGHLCPFGSCRRKRCRLRRL